MYFAATAVALCAAPPAPVPGPAAARGVLPGSATSAQRLRVAARVRDNPRFDVRVWHGRNGRIRVHAGAVEPPAAPTRASFVPPSEWGRRYRVLLSMDGHAAPNRVAALVASGAHIVVVRDPASPAPHVWWYDAFPGWFHFTDERSLEAVVATLLRSGSPPPRAMPTKPPPTRCG